jgi:hypothetical protein
MVYDDYMNSTTETSSTGVMGYRVTKELPRVSASGSLIGEYVFIGKRGATYLSYRASVAATTFQFMRPAGDFCALHGNYQLPVDYVAAGAVEFTDADRVA